MNKHETSCIEMVIEEMNQIKLDGKNAQRLYRIQGVLSTLVPMAKAVAVKDEESES